MPANQPRTEHCPKCGQPLPQPKRFPHVTGPVRRRVVEAIADNPGIDGPGILQLIYKDDPHGGASNLKIIGVLVYYARKQLRLDGFEISSSRGKGGGYQLRPIVRMPA